LREEPVEIADDFDTSPRHTRPIVTDLLDGLRRISGSRRPGMKKMRLRRPMLSPMRAMPLLPPVTTNNFSVKLGYLVTFRKSYTGYGIPAPLAGGSYCLPPLPNQGYV